MVRPVLDRRAEAVRRFNRFYTRRIGVLGGYLESPFSLTEVRVLYELAHRDRTTAAELASDLGLDRGYLSRILAGFRRRGLTDQTTPAHDGRRRVLRLTRRGRQVFAPLEARSRAEIGALLGPLASDAQDRLVGAMAAIESLLDGEPAARGNVVLRTHRSSDVGWVVERHGALYAREYGWDERFEALVAAIVAKFIEHIDPRRERCWIAERDGDRLGCVFLVKKSKTVAKLRLLLVEPEARGLGIGTRLVDECTRFARAAGYRKITLWTNSVLTGARRIYERAGYRLVKSERHHSFGQKLVGETWELDLPTVSAERRSACETSRSARSRQRGRPAAARATA